VRLPPTRLHVLVLLLLLLTSLACRAPHVAADTHEDGQQPLRVGFLIVDGVYNTELTAPYDIFHHSVFHTQPGMTVFTVGPDRSPVTTFEGLRLLPDHGFDDAPPIDLLVVPSAEHSMDTDLEDERLIAFVRERGASADLLLSLCDGAFLLAAAGLLDGLQCTTFPSDIGRFREMFPQLNVHEGVSFVHDGKAVTSAGGALSFDAALYVVERLYGPQPARGMAGGLCIDWDLDRIDHFRVEGALP
jgi:transcriptional regulator GlxA family with amidase domain